MSWVVDIGNTSLKWASADGAETEESFSVLRSNEGLAETLDEAWGDLPSPGDITCSCVAGLSVEHEMSSWCNAVWGIEPAYIRAPESGFGVINAYADVQCLGSDRWAALVAARHEIKTACCIVDCGTATTIDVLQGDGNHLGGLILPGVTLMRNALIEGTAVVIDDSEQGNSTLFARNTRDAIQGGSLYAMIATIDRVFQDVETELGGNVKRVLSGGDAGSLLPLLQGDIIYMPDLVLKGVAVIASGSIENTGVE